jgi:hypothetical protein
LNAAAAGFPAATGAGRSFAFPGNIAVFGPPCESTMVFWLSDKISVSGSPLERTTVFEPSCVKTSVSGSSCAAGTNLNEVSGGVSFAGLPASGADGGVPAAFDAGATFFAAAGGGAAAFTSVGLGATDTADDVVDGGFAVVRIAAGADSLDAEDGATA